MYITPRGEKIGILNKELSFQKFCFGGFDFMISASLNDWAMSVYNEVDW